VERNLYKEESGRVRRAIGGLHISGTLAFPGRALLRFLLPAFLEVSSVFRMQDSKVLQATGGLA